MMLLDTDILIECLRGSAAAQTWIEAEANNAKHYRHIPNLDLEVPYARQG